MENNSLLKKYLGIVLSTYFPETTQHDQGNKFNFRCNICGDSKQSKKKKRGWLLLYKGTWIFKCWNCPTPTMLAKQWLKIYFPEFYSMYIKEILQTDGIKKPENVTKQIIFDVKEKGIEVDQLQYFIPFSNVDFKSENFKIALKILQDRRIPKYVYKDWFFCFDNKFRDRIIIPIYDKDNKIIYWQGRTIFKNFEPKYMNCSVNKTKVILSQLEKVNKQKPILVFEGYIDSIFADNSINVLGYNFGKDVERELDKLQCYYVIDFETVEETKKRILELLQKGKYIFNWKRFLKYNNIPFRKKWDFNDLYIYMNRDKNFTFEELKCWFTNNWFDKIYF